MWNNIANNCFRVWKRVSVEVSRPMKKSIIVVMLALVLLAAPAAMAKSALTIDAVGLLFRTLSMEFETTIDALGRQTTLVVPLKFDQSTVGLGAGVRFYVDGIAHDGLYIGGYGGLFGLRGAEDGMTITQSPFHLTGIAGYKWWLDKSFVVDAGAGIGLVGPSEPIVRLGVGVIF